MADSKSKAIKDAIFEHMQALERDGTFKDVLINSHKKDLFDMDFGGHPAGILMSPSIESEEDTNRENVRTYTYEIVVVQKHENIDETSAPIENLIETILDKFDQDDLQGTSSTLRTAGALAGLEPSSSTPETVVAHNKSWVVFSVFLRAKAFYNS
jgi:hypothetical protein